MGVGIDSNFMVYNLFWYHPLDPIYQANEISLETNGYPTIPLDPVYQRVSCCLSKLRHGPRGFLHVHTPSLSTVYRTGLMAKISDFSCRSKPKKRAKSTHRNAINKRVSGPSRAEAVVCFFSKLPLIQKPHINQHWKSCFSTAKTLITAVSETINWWFKSRSTRKRWVQCPTLNGGFQEYNMTDWWFQTCFIFHNILG